MRCGAQEPVLQVVELYKLLVQMGLLHGESQLPSQLFRRRYVLGLVCCPKRAREEHESERSASCEEGTGEAGPHAFFDYQARGFGVGMVAQIRL